MSFSKYISNSSPQSLKELPLTHTTEHFFFREIVNDKKIKAAHCDVFNEHIIYFYYGRAPFRVAEEIGPRKDDFYDPVCFVVNPSSVGELRAIYPFDTGAFAKGYFKEHMHNDMKVENFLLGSDPKIIPQAVSTFFETNKKYFTGEAKSGLKFKHFQFELKAYYNLIQGGGESLADDRRLSIEVQKLGNLDLKDLEIIAVILPDTIIGDDETEEDSETIRMIVNEWHAVPRLYSTTLYSPPKDNYAAIRQELLNFYKSRGYL